MGLFISKRRVYCDTAPLGGAPEPVPDGDQPARAFEPPVADRDSRPQVLAGTGACLPESVAMPLWKRGLDLTFMLLSLPVWLPVMVFIALWIKVVSPGPIFFRQERIGFLGRRFMILKFRTMKVNVETQSHERYLEQLVRDNCPMTKLDAGDPRIIRGGRLLRAIGLDELPQLFNVLLGDMSLVGPRPCTPHEFVLYQAWQRERVNAPPGMTGYWQVNGKNKTTFTEMINMDIFYARNMSLPLDVEIIFKTVPALATQAVETRKAASATAPAKTQVNNNPAVEQC
ncbi:MAG: sugar transferase [Verrucomicrobia bacterium]|nr:sugar transferase [Verrucomicrobiota bacterium]